MPCNGFTKQIRLIYTIYQIYLICSAFAKFSEHPRKSRNCILSSSDPSSQYGTATCLRCLEILIPRMTKLMLHLSTTRMSDRCSQYLHREILQFIMENIFFIPSLRTSSSGQNLQFCFWIWHPNYQLLAVAPHLPNIFEVGALSLPMKVVNSKINFGILRYPKKDIHISISVCGSKLIPNRMPYKISYKYGSLAAYSVPTLHFLRHRFSQTNFMTWDFRTTKDLESCSQ